jgi:membrane-bound serine protease (ClpP class)
MVLLGIALLLTGGGLVVAEAHLPTFGALGAAGAGMLVAGAVLALSAAGAGLALMLAVGLIVGLSAAALVAVMARASFAAARPRAVTGVEGLVGHVGVLRSAPAPLGQVFVDGALWRARPTFDDELRVGDRVVVERVTGLVLSVRRAEEWEIEP